MMIANLNFSLSDSKNPISTVLVTSCIKGEGKTLVSAYLSKILSFSDDKIIESKMLRKYRHKFYSMNKFMELKKYHSEWNDESWDEIEIEELLKEFLSKKN